MGRTDPIEGSEKSLRGDEITVYDYLAPSNGGYYISEDLGKPVPHVVGSESITESDSFGDITRDVHGDHMEVDSELRETLDRDEVKLLRSKPGVSRILTKGVQQASNQSTCHGNIPAKRHIVAELQTRATYDMVQPTDIKTKKYLLHHANDGQEAYMEANSKCQVDRSHAEGANINIAPWRPVEQRKTFLDLPPWLKDLVIKSNVTDMDEWEHYEIIRNDCSASDKYFKHKNYSHIFRSKPDVVRFLATGEVKKNNIWQKISPGHSGQDPGASRPRKRKAEPHTPTNNPQGFGWPRGGMGPISRELREQGWL